MTTCGIPLQDSCVAVLMAIIPVLAPPPIQIHLLLLPSVGKGGQQSVNVNISATTPAFDNSR